MTEVRKGSIEKPKGKAPSRLAAIGRYILQPEVLAICSARESAVRAVRSSSPTRWPKLIGVQPFHAQTFHGMRHDCGDKAGFIQANIALALERARHR